MLYYLILGFIEIVVFVVFYQLIDSLICKYRRGNNKINKNTVILITGASMGLVNSKKLK